MEQHKDTILITGGSGLVGTRLTELLLDSGYRVKHLSTRQKGGVRVLDNGVHVYGWDPANHTMDREALSDVGQIINLAGASISARWTKAYKALIRSSRVDSLRTLYTALSEIEHRVDALISSSAVGYYPSETGVVFEEDAAPDDGFLGRVCQEWEEEANRFKALGLRVALMRTGIVLSASGGALPVIARTVRWFVGAPLGPGNQVLPWVHIDDLSRMYMHALQQPLEGPYNAVGLVGATNKSFTRSVARVLRRPVWPISVPAFVLRTVLGEQATLVLMSSPSSPERLIKTGFTYRYTDLDIALIDILI
ncbi:TIGR01777 family protein [Cryomorphaceae bacterium]|nr:TIGR01777 family protein [Cryomorphaceae bacterium]